MFAVAKVYVVLPFLTMPSVSSPVDEDSFFLQRSQGGFRHLKVSCDIDALKNKPENILCFFRCPSQPMAGTRCASSWIIPWEL